MYKILLVLVALGVMGGGFFLYQGTRTEIVPALSNQEATTTPNVITVTMLSKDVFLTQKDSQDVVKVEKTATTSMGSTVRTSATGRALLETAQKKMVLDHDTQITIPSENNEKVSRIVLLGGSIWSRVEKIFEKGEYYEIQTQNTVAAVRGTSFGVTYLNGVTTVQVGKSAVAVTPLDPVTGARMEEKTIVVPAGKKAVLDMKKTGTVVSDLTAKDKADTWFKFNATLESTSDTVSDTTNAPPPTPPAADIKAPLPKTPEPTPPPVTPTPPPAPTPPSTSGPTPPPPSGQTLPPIPIGLSSVSPTSVSGKSTETITLHGTSLRSIASLSMVAQDDLTPIDVRGFNVVDDTTITFILPPGLVPGLYNVVCVSAAEQGASLDRSLTVF